MFPINFINFIRNLIKNPQNLNIWVKKKKIRSPLFRFFGSGILIYKLNYFFQIFYILTIFNMYFIYKFIRFETLTYFFFSKRIFY